MLDVVVVGCGYIAQAEQIPGWVQTPDARICAVVDPRNEVAAAIGSALGVPSFAALSEALDQTNAAAVHICTPVPSHAPLIEEAVGRGVHVLVEKPLALTADEGERLVGLAAQRGVTLMVATPRAYDADVSHALQLVRAGELGELVGVRSFWAISLPPKFTSLAPAPRVNNESYTAAGVVGLRQRLLEESVHHLGLLRDFCPGEATVESVSISGSLLHIVLGLGGVTAWHTNASPSCHREELEVYGSEGSVTAQPWSPHFPWRYGSSLVTKRGLAEDLVPHIARTNGYWGQIEDFVSVVKGDSPGRRPVEEAVKDLALIEMILAHAEDRVSP